MSSKHHKHHHTSQRSETKSMSIARKIISFFLFISIFALSVGACTKAVVLNPEIMASKLTDQEYSNALFLDVQQYAYDLCDKSSVPRSVVDDTLDYSAITEINEAYVIGNLCGDEKYTNSTYTDKLDELNSSLIESVKAELKNQNIKINDKQAKNGISTFAEKIVDYTEGAIEIEYLAQIQTVTNVSRVGLIVLIVISSIFVVIFALAILSIGKKKYRSVRAICYSFIAGGMLDFIMVLGVEIVKKTKELYIFPTYLCEAAMRYVEDSKNVFVGAGMAAFVVAIILMTLIWKLKRDDK